MMQEMKRWIAGAVALLAALACAAQQAPAAPGAAASAPAAAMRWFAVELRTGPKWDSSKPPQEQAAFREHSAHLRSLRQQGHIKLGARYGEVGLIVVQATTLEQARALFDADPSLQQQTFAITVHEMGVFYPGWVGAAAPAAR